MINPSQPPWILNIPCWRGVFKQCIESSVKTFEPSLSAQYVVVAHSDTAGRQFIDKCSTVWSWIREVGVLVQQHNPLVPEIDQPMRDGDHGGDLIQPDASDSQLDKSAEQCEDRNLPLNETLKHFL